MASLTHFLKTITKKHNKLAHTLKHYTYFLSTQTHPSPPVAKKVPYNVTTAHGATLQDPYHWMSDTHDQDFVNYIKNENVYAEGFMKYTKNVQSGLFNEMVKRLPQVIATPPERWGDWLYYQYIPESKEYPVLCRKPAVESTNWVKHVVNYARKGFVNEEILLDWNEIAKEHGYVHVGTCRVSPNHHFLAYTIDITGEERFILQVKDLQSGTRTPTLRIEDVVSLAWGQDSCTLIYTLCDQNQRPYRVQCTTLGSNPVSDILMFTEKDSSFCVDITSTKDGKFITVNSNSRTSSEEGVHNRRK